jgi:hypothetical protein
MFGTPFIKARMTRDRWIEIKNNLHPDITALMEDFRKRNKQYYYPTLEMSIDETIFLYKGRVCF